MLQYVNNPRGREYVTFTRIPTCTSQVHEQFRSSRVNFYLRTLLLINLTNLNLIFQHIIHILCIHYNTRRLILKGCLTLSKLFYLERPVSILSTWRLSVLSLDCSLILPPIVKHSEEHATESLAYSLDIHFRPPVTSLPFTSEAVKAPLTHSYADVFKK